MAEEQTQGGLCAVLVHEAAVLRALVYSERGLLRQRVESVADRIRVIAQEILQHPQVGVAEGPGAHKADVTESGPPPEVYRDRTQALMALGRLAAACGFEVGVRPRITDPQWVLLFIELPTGQVSWLLPRRSVDLDAWPAYDKPWDEHTPDEQRLRLGAFIHRCGAVLQGQAGGK